MSPAIANTTFRNSIYVIEEEPSCDMETDHSCPREQIDAEFKNSRNNLSQIRVNIRMNELDNVVKYINENEHKNVFSELFTLTDAYDENRDEITSTISVPIRRLSAGYRQPSVQQSTNTRSSPSTSNDKFLSEQQQNVEVGSNLEVRSGNLVMIAQEQSQKPFSFNSSRANSRTLHLSRYPVIVKIYRRSYEKYAIISRTRHNPTTPSFFLKLKHSRVTQSLFNPSHFSVVDNGPAAKSITFEASSPEMAREWMGAFSQDFPHSPVGSLNHNKYFQGRDTFPRLNLQSLNSCTVSSESSPARTVPYSHLMPVLSESLLEDDVQADISTLVK